MLYTKKRMSYLSSRAFLFKVVAVTSIVIAVLLISLWAERLLVENNTIRSLVEGYGYFGIFVLAMFSGFNIFLPIPPAAFIPVFVTAGLNPWIAIGIISFGMILGDSFGYFLGSMGRSVDAKFLDKIRKFYAKFSKKYHALRDTLIFMYISVAPAPNELLVVPLGVLGYPYRKLIVFFIFGNVIYNTLIYTGFNHLLAWVKLIGF